MSYLYLNINLAITLIIYFIRIWYIYKNQPKEYSDSYRHIYGLSIYFNKPDDSKATKKIKRNINNITILCYVFIAVQCVLIIANKYYLHQ